MVMQVHRLIVFYMEKMPSFSSFDTECFIAFFITVLKEAKNICFLYVGPVSPAVSSSSWKATAY